jgi:hypothetical protein
MENEENCIEETMEEHILRRLASLEHRVDGLNTEIRMHSSIELGGNKKTIFLKGRVDDLEKAFRLLNPKD